MDSIAVQRIRSSRRGSDLPKCCNCVAFVTWARYIGIEQKTWIDSRYDLEEGCSEMEHGSSEQKVLFNSPLELL